MVFICSSWDIKYVSNNVLIKVSLSWDLVSFSCVVSFSVCELNVYYWIGSITYHCALT